MPADALVADLESALAAVPIFDAHSHLDPRAPAARSLDDILGYHYYTELAHSCGIRSRNWRTAPGRGACARRAGRDAALPQRRPRGLVPPHRRVVLRLGRQPPGVADYERLSASAGACFARPGWDGEVLAKSAIECVFLTNEFDRRLDRL